MDLPSTTSNVVKKKTADFGADGGLAQLCPFSGEHILRIGDGSRFAGPGWYTVPFDNDSQAIKALGVRARIDQRIPATEYITQCPWTGQRLEPKRTDDGFRYGGRFWRSELFATYAAAAHWFSRRNGRHPIFPADVTTELTRPLTDGEQSVKEAGEMMAPHEGDEEAAR